MDSVKGYCAALLFAGLACLTTASVAGATDIKALAEKPQDFLGQDVEMKGTCVKGGKAGDVLGYECTTAGGVYVNADDIEPEEAKDKLAGECAGASCEMTLQFVPHSFTTSGVIEPDKSIVIFNTEKAKVSF